MKVIQFDAFGAAHEVARSVDIPEPDPPGTGEVLVEVEVFPINPVDLLTISGGYAVRPPLPALPGSEALGRVISVGEGVTQVSAGDRVVMMSRENWAQRKTIRAGEAIPIRVDADPLQLAMLKINPATAYLLLTRYRELAAGDWLIQNAANSGVGTYLISLAKARGVRTVNVVRRDDLAVSLKERGADIVLVDGPDLAERVAEAIGDGNMPLAIDAVAGEATGRLAQCLSEGGVVVNYGLLSGMPCAIDPHMVVFRGITLTGFWLVNFLGTMSSGERASLYAELAQRIASGELHVDVEAVYPIEEIQTALEHAARAGRDGKILVTANGPLSN
ncbi:MAG: zinc-dependent alcohol dehydrogenase family protein [Gammaproteobacteria bacterium]|nr:zinc-dependent alcohol dehydrogenase family protein [Gammaproteobacteria bacterium]